MLVPLLSPPQVWQQLKGLLCCYADMHLHLETQHVVFLQCVQPDLRKVHTHKHKCGLKGCIPLLLYRSCCQKVPFLNRTTDDSTPIGYGFQRAKITPGSTGSTLSMSVVQKQAWRKHLTFSFGVLQYEVSGCTKINSGMKQVCLLNIPYPGDHQTQHLHCFSQKLIPSWFWHPLASVLRHYCSSGTSGKQMAASALERSCNIQ